MATIKEITNRVENILELYAMITMRDEEIATLQTQVNELVTALEAIKDFAPDHATHIHAIIENTLAKQKGG